MYSSNAATGLLGEELAQCYLEEMGYVILDKNYKCKVGEIDIIAKDKEYIVFIEVKARHNLHFGTPGEAVTLPKQYKIYRTAQFYIIEKKLYRFDFRFDVVEVTLSPKDNSHSIKLIKDAFSTN